MKFETLPYYARKGIGIPRTEIFNNLKRLYLQETSIKVQDLASKLEITPQYLSMWSNPDNNRNPPMWAIIRLCCWLDLYIMINGDKVTIEQKNNEY